MRSRTMLSRVEFGVVMPLAEGLTAPDVADGLRAPRRYGLSTPETGQ